MSFLVIHDNDYETTRHVYESSSNWDFGKKILHERDMYNNFNRDLTKLF